MFLMYALTFQKKKEKHHTEVLLTFYGTAQSSTFQSNNSVAPIVVLNAIVDDETIRYFFEDFKSPVGRKEKKEKQ